MDSRNHPGPEDDELRRGANGPQHPTRQSGALRHVVINGGLCWGMAASVCTYLAGFVLYLQAPFRVGYLLSTIGIGFIAGVVWGISTWFLAIRKRDGRGYPLKDGKPPVADWLGDKDDKQHLENLAIVKDGSLQPGDIIAWTVKGGTSGHSSFHIGGNVWFMLAQTTPGGVPKAATLRFVNSRLAGFFGGHEPYVVRR